MGKINNDNYVVIQGWMRNELNLKGNELMVYAIIYGFSQDGENDFTGSAAYMADWIGSTKQTVFNILKSLTERGLIKKTDVYNNGVKFCHYSAIPPIKNFDRGVVKKFDGGDQKILPNNIDINNNNNIDNIYSPAQNGQMDFPKRANGNDQKGKPIPDINTDINSDNNIYSPAQESEEIPYSEIVDYLNRICNTAYRASTKKTKSLIKARWNEGFRVDDFKKVIDNKSSQWLNDPKFSEYLRPETLFGTKFESYLNQKKVVKKTNIETNQSFGDELTRSQDDLCRMIGFNV